MGFSGSLTLLLVLTLVVIVATGVGDCVGVVVFFTTNANVEKPGVVDYRVL
jgi:hypothetical protein